MGMDVYGKSGNYFRANMWSWRPINAIIDIVNDKHELGLNTDGFAYNDGAGIDNQEQCSILADKIEELLDTEELEGSDLIYINLGGWYCDDKFHYDDQIAESLNLDYPIGSFLYSSVVGPEGEVYKPSHSTDVEHIKEFIDFLRTCDGFKIY